MPTKDLVRQSKSPCPDQCSPACRYRKGPWPEAISLARRTCHPRFHMLGGITNPMTPRLVGVVGGRVQRHTR